MKAEKRKGEQEDEGNNKKAKVNPQVSYSWIYLNRFRTSGNCSYH
jgi:hypothetical protein